MNSVLLGAGSPPFVTWLSLVSYRDVRNAMHYPVYPGLQWMQINTQESPLSVAATCLIGIIIPTIWGLYLWRSALSELRSLGRPALQVTTEVAVVAFPTLSWLRRRHSIG